MKIKNTIQMLKRFLRQTCRRLTRRASSPTRARCGLLRAEFECLESRSMLSVAPVGDGYQLDFDRLPKPDFGDIAIWPIRPIEGGARPLPPDYPWLPPLQLEPNLPYPPSESSDDSSDLGGFTEIDNSDKGQPGILAGPASDKVTREVQQMLDSLRYVPNSDSSGVSTEPELTPLSTQDAVPLTLTGALRLDDLPEGGMVALLHDAVIVQSVAKDSAPHDDIDSWLNTPVRMDSAHGKFQVFEVSTGEAAPAPPPPVNESPFLPPLNSFPEFPPAAAFESTSHISIPAASAPAIVQATTEIIADAPSSPAVPLEKTNNTSNSKSAAAAAIFVFLAVRAARAAKTTDASEPPSQATLAVRRPMHAEPMS